jgi:hypothetical protein
MPLMATVRIALASEDAKYVSSSSKEDEDERGQLIASEPLVKGINYVLLPSSAIGNGVYIVRLLTEGETIDNVKLVISR